MGFGAVEGLIGGPRRTRSFLYKRKRSAVIDELDMPNWSRIVHRRVEEKRRQVSFLLEEIAEKLESETAFLLVPSRETPEVWTIPEGWIYSEKEFPTNLSISGEADIIEKALSEESVVLDAKIGDTIPEPLANSGVESGIAVAIGYPKREALLMVCNSKKLVGRPPYQVHYTRADDELAVVMARVISMDGVGKSIREKIPGMKPMVKDSQSKDLWSKEKEKLLKTHPGWFVAYQNGKRVALEPSLDRLAAALNKKLGTSRNPCEFHDIVERSAVLRGPSPRVRPAWAER